MKRASRKSAILIVGDWVVDDSWQTGTYRSKTSLREGSWHLRAEPNESPIVAFCGAGRVASLLRYDGPSGQVPHCILGLGAWHEGDTMFLKSLFDFNYRRSLSPDKVWNDQPTPPDDVLLFNIAGQTARTTRAYRTYTRQGGKLTVQGRIDWESPLPPSSSIVQAATDKLLSKDVPEVSAVVIKDVSKGVISKNLVQFLVQMYDNVPWFVSTKSWNPDWLPSLVPLKQLKLVFFHPVATRAALQDDLTNTSDPIDSWIVPGKTEPTYGAVQAINQREQTLTHGFSGRHPILVFGQEEGEVIAKEEEKYVVCRLPSEDYANVGWASAFFASMIHTTLKKKGDVGIAVRDALSYAKKWAAAESSFLLNDGHSTRPAGPNMLPPISHRDENLKVHMGKWLELSDAWEHVRSYLYLDLRSKSKGQRDVAERSAADEGVGQFDLSPDTVDVGEMELWRSMTLLPGYVCLDPQKRRGISRIKGLLRDSGELSEQRALEIVAEPGSGKSYLVKCLADAEKLDVIEFNLTHLHSREELVSCFEKIATQQAENKGKPLIVFFDEINAGISGSPVYDAFLSPLEDSVYIRKLLKFHLLPCVWLFVGTEPDPNQPKYEDFKNRMMGPTVRLGPLKENEKKYAGVQLIQQRFPEVQRVSVDVLEAIGQIKGSVRDIKRWVRQLENVRQRAVRCYNVPEMRQGTRQTPERMVVIR